MNRATSDWRSIFEMWPSVIPRRGIVVTTFQETIPFVDFRVGDAALLVERDRPDSHGGRKIMLGWNAISALKLTDVSELSVYEPMGFMGS